MYIKNLRDHLASIGLVASAVLIAVATIDVAKAEAITDPQRDIAVIDIPNPREGNLLMLRGLVGQGTASFRIDSACSTIPVRFVAGDFSGEHVDMGRTGSIRIVITNPDVIRELFAGRDLVSDMVRVSSDAADQAADLYLEHGLSAETGFVINPGRNLLADIVGANATFMECDPQPTTRP